MVGDVVSHYKIIEPLGSGAMGEVFLAEDTRLGRRVALKFLPRHLTSDLTAKARFMSEARAASALDHPNICTVHEIGESADGRLILAMAFCDGESIKAHIAGGPLPVAEAVDWAAQIADGLTEAHARGIVHRDIKPANLIVTRTGRVKIVDFGIARLPDASITTTGVVVGTPAYMAPEQARGEAVDGRADLWSLGVVLYEMVSGKPPFGGTSLEETLYALLHRTPEPIERLSPNLSPTVARIVARALMKDPVARYQQAEQMLADLQACQQQLVRAERQAVPPSSAECRPSIAVLPFANLSGDREQDYFCEGMTEELTIALGRLRSLRVVAHTSALQFKGQAMDIRRVGELLNVQTVVEGSVRKAGNRLRVTALVVNAADGYHLWSERYDRDLDDVFAVQDEIASAITEKLKVELIAPRGAPIVKRPTDNLEAYQLYLKGRYLWARRYSLGPEPAMKCFARAIELEPDFPAALAGMADCYVSLGIFALAPVPQLLPKTRALIDRALALDVNSVEAHHALGVLHVFLAWNWPVADAAFTRALDLNPDLSLTRAYRAVALSWMGREDDALREASAAVALDPLSAFVAYMVAASCYSRRLYGRAIEEAERSAELDPHMVLANYILASSLSAVGRHVEAVAAARGAVEASRRSAFMVMVLATVLADAGQDDEARVLLNELRDRKRTEYVADGVLACAFAALREWDNAFDAIERSVAEEDGRYPFLLVPHTLDPVRGDPRYLRILKTIGYTGTSAVLLGGR